ncbi:hypothetical protein [Chitinophaga agri]|uniref:Uncharacterized protein n=1 Tax=Chitinophaga agri TaxID=2703787 RepID=A0A6B9ZJB7_9BACT|nr:hypothetical protein [Chitinophaga agri]QHS61889.1 hypothetical protein GWR21_20465 [Chitinophaga agri]
MQKLSVKKFSFLGMALLGASAITAAFIPSESKADNAKFALDGTLTGSGNSITCQPKESGPTVPADCHNTLTAGGASATSVGAAATSGDAPSAGADTNTTVTGDK